RTEATGGGAVADWLGSWTVFYWAWWISWTPFVVVMIGMCVALMRDLRRDPQIVRQEFGVEAVESAVIEGHAKYDGDFEIRIGPGTTPVTDERHKHESGDPGSGTASTSTLSKEKERPTD
ncbi:BCCT family transporter, partial [Streptomyces californicus]|uniref:BCCT family transporter n=1 Tax=Streptomyces californicus TaxID=67351 RepID=UPI00368304CC